ncbi:hypothetical protein H7J06_11660 [Mycobacterium hodleri]|uniref:hypothetical protein n=1 Tax=Mycolicibacterium hodleri TaxID=49897 RepID=UPI0021F2D0D1|nr:hypothetical protein [Mycolicibacterium hodleri]MCV7133642.1 hypothetical protein [Mycolicibacterium hodleri]
MNVMFGDEDSARLYGSSAALTARFGPQGARAISCHLAQLDAAHDLAELCALPGIQTYRGDEGQVLTFRAANLTITGNVEAASPRTVDAWTFVIADITVGVRTSERSAR